MQLASSPAFPEPLLAAMWQLNENSRLGFRLAGNTLHQGFGAGKYLIGIGDTASVVRYAWLESLKAPQQSASSTSTTQGQNTDYVSVAYWWTGAKGFGHIGVGVDTDDTQGFSTADPKTPWWKRLLGAPQAGTEDDITAHTNKKTGEVAPHSYMHIPISASQAAEMKAAMADRTANPGHYNIIFNNCAGFVESVLHAGGVSGVPHAEVFGPAVLGAILAYENSWR